MKKHITIKNIASEAGVSVATVSYVLNDKPGQTISEKTRKKVLQVVNMFGYSPNASAQALATSRTNTVAVLFPETDFCLKKAEQKVFLDGLAAALEAKKYHLIYLSGSAERYDFSDALLCCDNSKEYFHSIGDKTFAPLIAVDCIVDDPLFFQVNTDYAAAARGAQGYFNAPYRYVGLKATDEAVTERIRAAFERTGTVADMKDIFELIDTEEQNFAVTQSALAQLLSAAGKNVYFAPSSCPAKFETIIECIELAVGRVVITKHDLIV